MFTYNYRLLLTASLLALAACSGPEDSTSTEREAAVAAPTDAALVTFSTGQQQVSELATGPLEQREISTRVPANGHLALPPQGLASVSPLTGGMIRSITVLEGDYVKKGKVLATLENTELLKLQEDYLTTRNQLNFALQDYERQKTLADEQVGARRKYEQAQTDLQVQQARLQALARQLQTYGISSKRLDAGHITSSISLVAPISGYVQQIDANLGTYAEPNKPILQLVDDHHLHLDLHVFEKDYYKLEKGQKVIFSLPNVAAGEAEATVFAIGKSFEGESRMVPVHAEIKNNSNKGLLPGMYINAHILTGKRTVPALPEEAVVLYKGKPYVFLQESDTTFRMAAVATGVTENGYTEILDTSNIPSAAPVVLRGTYYILAEKMKSEVAEE